MRNKIKPHSSAYPPSPLTLAHYPNVANLAMDNLLCTGKWKVTDPFSIVRIRFLDGILTKAVRPTSTGITYNRSKLAQFYQRICLTVPFTAETFRRKFLVLFFSRKLERSFSTKRHDHGCRTREKKSIATVIMMSPRDKGMARSLWNFSWTSKQFIRLKLKHKGKTHGARAPSRSLVEFSRRATLIAPLDFSPEVTVSGDFSSTSFIWRPLARTAAASCWKSDQRSEEQEVENETRKKPCSPWDRQRSLRDVLPEATLCFLFLFFILAARDFKIRHG